MDIIERLHRVSQAPIAPSYCLAAQDAAALIAALRASLSELVVTYVGDHRAGHVTTMPREAQAIIARATAVLEPNQ
jgi:hypothetical protein